MGSLAGGAGSSNLKAPRSLKGSSSGERHDKMGLLGRSLQVQYGGKTGLDAAISAERCWSDLNGGTCLLN